MLSHGVGEASKQDLRVELLQAGNNRVVNNPVDSNKAGNSLVVNNREGKAVFLKCLSSSNNPSRNRAGAIVLSVRWRVRSSQTRAIRDIRAQSLLVNISSNSLTTRTICISTTTAKGRRLMPNKTVNALSNAKRLRRRHHRAINARHQDMGAAPTDSRALRSRHNLILRNARTDIFNRSLHHRMVA